MAIKKIIFDDNSEEEFIPTFPEDFEEWNSLRKSWHLHYQRSKWEQNKIFHHLATDLEDYAKDEYDLVDADEINDIDKFNDSKILQEAKKRGLLNKYAIINENINNQDFIQRFCEIINRGNEIELASLLDELERKYRIA
jgi:hypothetical protein